MALLSLVAKLGLDKSGFEQGLDSASKRVSAFGSGLKATLAGAFSLAAISAFVRDLNQTIGRIKDLSEQFAVTTNEVQNVDFALKQSGMAFEDFGQAMNKMGQARRDAVEGNDELRSVFAKYGLTLQQLNSPQLRNFDLLMMMSEAMSKMNITAREQVQIQDLLGPKAAKLANVLGGLSQTKPPELFSEEDIQRIDKASKSIESLYSTIQKMAAAPIGRFAETLDQGLKDWSNKPGKWWQKLFTTDMKGGPLGKATMSALFGDDSMEKTVGGIGKAVAGLFGNAAKGIIGQVIPPVAQPDAGALFDVDKNKKAVSASLKGASLPTLQSSDQLGRIGAFSGGGVGTLQSQMKKTADTLVEIRNVLAIRGIVIKDL
jgi:hypothetical protein